MLPDYPDTIDYMENLKVVDRCSECGEGIMEGEEYYDIGGQPICLECMSYHKKTAKEQFLN